MIGSVHFPKRDTVICAQRPVTIATNKASHRKYKKCAARKTPTAWVHNFHHPSPSAKGPKQTTRERGKRRRSFRRC